MRQLAYARLIQAALLLRDTHGGDSLEYGFIESNYGRVAALRLPNSEHFALSNIISCSASGREELYYGRDLVFEDCPTANVSSPGYLHVQSAINEACLPRHRILQLAMEWVRTDIFGSAYIVRDGFRISAECAKSGLSLSLDQTIKGDLRTTLNDTKSYVQLLSDKWEFTDGTDQSRIIAVIEPVWDFIDRAAFSNKELSKLSLQMGEQQRVIQVVTERNKTLTFSIDQVSYDYRVLALRRLSPEEPDSVYQSYACTSCVEEKHPESERCVSESRPLTDECGRIIGDCSENWWIVKSLCEACVIPM